MSKKTRVRLTVVYEYDLQHDWFEGCTTSEEVIAKEAEYLEDGAYFAESLMSKDVIETRLELVEPVG
jgi:hypothetical protein